jgi:hypothetical protein
MAEQGAVIQKGPGHTVTCSSVEVPVTAKTLSEQSGDVKLEWDGIAAHTKHDHESSFWFSVPPREGEVCDGVCVDEVIARAAKRGGRLRGRLRVEHRTDVYPKVAGGCAKYLTESVTLDFEKATHGIHPVLEEGYDFLTMYNEPTMTEIEDVPCP